MDDDDDSDCFKDIKEMNLDDMIMMSLFACVHRSISWIVAHVAREKLDGTNIDIGLHRQCDDHHHISSFGANAIYP